MPLIGRDVEREALLAAVAVVGEDGRSRIAVVAGEPGIGKTTLLEALGEADVPRLTVLAGRAAEFEREVPFAAFQDAVEPFLRGLDLPALNRLVEGTEAAGVVLPELVAHTQAPAGDVERYQVHRAIRTLLERLAAGRTLMLSLDDAQWADPASVELIAALLRRPPDAAVLMVIAHRTGGLPDVLAREVAAADREGRVTAVALGPLTTTEAEALVGSDARYDDAGGNPFYLLQLARAEGDGEVQRGADEVLTGVVPPAVATSLAMELGTLSTLAQAVAQAAAVAGETFDPQLVADVAGVDEEDAFEALDELAAADLVRADPVRNAFRFRHPLVRRGVYGSIVGGWRVAAHRRADRALAARGAGAMTRAHHVERASVMGDVAAAELLLAAADEARASAPGLSVRWRAAAVERLPEAGPGSDRRADELPVLGRAMAHAGRLEESLEAFARAGEDVAVQADSARVELLLGRAEAAGARLDRALRAAGDDPRAVALLETRRTSVLRAGFRTELMLPAAERAVAAAQAVGDPLLIAGAAGQLALAHAVGGEHADARAALVVLEAAVGRLDEGALGDAADDLASAAWTSWYVGAFSAADQLSLRGLAAARTAARADVSVDLLCTRTLTLLSLARIPEAVETALAALEGAQLLGSPGSIAGAQVMRCLALLPAGDVTGAMDAGEAALAGAQAGGTPTHVASAAWALSDVRHEAGRPRAAIELVVERMGGPDLPDYLPVMRPTVYALLTSCAAADDSPEEAAGWAARSVDAGAALGTGVLVAQGQRATAEALLAGGEDLDRAVALLEAADAACLRDDARHERLRLRFVLGGVQARQGATEAAATTWRALSAEARECGAELLRAKATRALRAAGHHVAAPTPAAGGLLTAREREVAELVRERLTNREIAARLFLSEKTIETHLSRVFGKLGVRARADVARALEAESA